MSVYIIICRWYWRKLTTKLPCSSPILLGWFESFALQNIQAFFKNEVTNISVCTKHKPSFILREFTSFMNKFEVVSLFRSSLIKPVRVCTFYTDIVY